LIRDPCYNTTNHDIDIQYCDIRDNDTDSHTISNSVVIPSLGYVVLARNGNTEENGGVIEDYMYSSFVLGNASDEIILECDTVEIDRVEYDGGPNFPNPDGASMILDDPAHDNNIGSNWCVSTSPFGDGDLGTPGAQNDTCWEVCTDNDQDGYSIEGGGCGPVDCDDTRPDVNPGATEVCDNGLDDDCDGYTDGDDPDCQPGPSCTDYYKDEDDDTYGLTSDTQCLLEPDGDYTATRGGDCDDTSPDVNPAATEICDDGIDNDCDGYVDDNDSDCQVSPPGGPGGGAGPISLRIFNETNKEIYPNRAIVTWFTNLSATSRVIYDTVSHSTLGTAPNYGYLPSEVCLGKRVCFSFPLAFEEKQR